jgi:prepilin-type processing-associated H-X9-DG protein/prepilin-type N-terminal cleavage/methylation domain-containing protein
LGNSGQLSSISGAVSFTQSSTNAAGAKISMIDATLNLGTNDSPSSQPRLAPSWDAWARSVGYTAQSLQVRGCLAMRHTFQSKARGFSLIELITVIGLIAVLMAILLPVLRRSRQASKRTVCASNLRQLSAAIALYAHNNHGWIPRDATTDRADREPWPVLLSPYLVGRKEITVSDLPKIAVLQCPSHPQEGLPSGFVINAFAFETAPSWAPDGPIKITAPQRPSELPWLLDAATDFPIAAAPPLSDKVFGVEFHDIYSPEHLPAGSKHRISDTRHGSRTSNVLYFDGHVAIIHQGELKLEMFDDQVRVRATTMPQTQPSR